MRAYKLVRSRRDGSLASLFIGRGDTLPLGVWMKAEDIPTKGYAHRPGWHTMKTPKAPHLTMKGRVWVEVVIDDYSMFERPVSQGGIWYLANYMKIIGRI
jgi:hypothetical protein